MSLILEETPVMKGYKMGELHVLVARKRFTHKCILLCNSQSDARPCTYTEQLSKRRKEPSKAQGLMQSSAEEFIGI